jgi:hypothetical protein
MKLFLTNLAYMALLGYGSFYMGECSYRRRGIPSTSSALSNFAFLTALVVVCAIGATWFEERKRRRKHKGP